MSGSGVRDPRDELFVFAARLARYSFALIENLQLEVVLELLLDETRERGFLIRIQGFVGDEMHRYSLPGLLNHLVLPDGRDGPEIPESNQRPVPVAVWLLQQPFELSQLSRFEHLRGQPLRLGKLRHQRRNLCRQAEPDRRPGVRAGAGSFAALDVRVLGQSGRLWWQ
jgi:hypothetical protein